MSTQKRPLDKDESTEEPPSLKRLRGSKGEKVPVFPAQRKTTLAEIRERFKEPTLPRNAHPRDELIKLDTSWDPEKKRRKHDYYLRATLESEWVLKKGTVSASGFGTHWTWPFVQERRAKASAAAMNRKLEEELGRPLKPEEVTTWQMIAEEWNQAAEYGTELHALYDKILNGEMLTDDEEAKIPQGFLDAMAAHPTWDAYRTEWSVYDLELDVIGQLDVIFRDRETGVFILGDWKVVLFTRKKDSYFPALHPQHWKDGTSTERHGSAWHPLFPKLEDTKVNKAMFQTNVYRMAVERNYGITIGEIHVFSFPPEDLNKFEEHVIPIRDLMPAFALMPFKWDDPRHLGEGQLACERVTEDVEGPTKVYGWQTYLPLPPEEHVWISKKWARCGCGGDHKRQALKSCPKKEFDLPDSDWQFSAYPHGVYGGAEYTREELKISQLVFERHLLMQPAPLLRRWKELYGKVLLSWASETEGHAAVLARYVNALGSGRITLRPEPDVITIDDFFVPIAPPLLSCPDCKTPAPAQVACDARASCLSWSCGGCEGKTVTKKVTRVL